MSHAVAIALAPQEIRIGIDIESKRDKAALLLSRYASEEEVRRMNADGTSAVELWSAKETVYKLAEGAIAGFGEKIVYQGREGDLLLILSKPQDLPDHLHHVRTLPLADLGLLTYALSPDSPDDIPLTWSISPPSAVSDDPQFYILYFDPYSTKYLSVDYPIMMKIQVLDINDKKVAEIVSDEPILQSIDDGLDLLGNLYYQGIEQVVMYEKDITPAFFDLKTKIAGEILQKFVQYRMPLIIVGDFSKYQSKSLDEFILESNKGRHVSFVNSRSEAMALLGNR